MKTKQSKLELELLKVTKLKPVGKENRQKFIGRLALAVNAFNQKKYDTLSDAAKDWYESAVAASNQREELPDPSVKKMNLAEKQAQLKLAKKKKKLVPPSWKELAKMDEDEIESLVDEHEIDFGDEEFEDLEDIQRFIAKELGIKRPAKVKATLEERDPDALTWGKVHKMSESKIMDLIEEEGIKFGNKQFEDLAEVADFVCRKLGVERPASLKKAPKKKAKPKVKKAAKKAVKKAAPKKVVESLRKHPLRWYEGKLRAIGIAGQNLDKVMVIVRKM